MMEANHGPILFSGAAVGDDEQGLGGNASLWGIPSRETGSNQPYLEVTAVPEPCTLLLVSGGLIGLAGRNRRVRP
jgi:hypothetical protein